MNIHEKGRKRLWWRKALYFVGIDVTTALHWHAILKPRFFVIILSIGGFFLVSFLGVVKYSTSPSFCNSCHIMEPYYNAWEASSHNHVACVECHYAPGTPRTVFWKKFQGLSQVAKYVTRTYSSKPFAEIDDASCLRSGCHSRRLLKGRVISENGVKFDHAAHIMETRKGMQLKCVTCHSQIVVGTHIEVTYSSCYLCHFKGRSEGTNVKQLGGCRACHELDDKSVEIDSVVFTHSDYISRQGVSCENCHANIVQGDGLAPRERCLTCHNQPEKLAMYSEYSDRPFIHENHVTEHNVACFHCHREILHGFGVNAGSPPTAEVGAVLEGAVALRAESKMDRQPAVSFECGRCHSGKHSGELAIYSGRLPSFVDLEDMPSPMYLAHVDCAGCHYQESQTAVDGEIKDDLSFTSSTSSASFASSESCERCHGMEFKGIWAETTAELESTLAMLDEKAEALLIGVEGMSLPEDEENELLRDLREVKWLREFIKTYRGEHNIYLASLMVRRADRLLSSLGARVKIKLPNLASMPLVSGSYCATLCHEGVGVLTPPETVNAFGKEMSHVGHSVFLKCVQCHEVGTHKVVPLKEGLQETLCAACHGM